MPENPYSPPASEYEIPDAPRSHGWKVEENQLWIAVGAQLPMIDPHNGLSDDTMTLCPLKIKSTLRWIPAALAGCLIILLIGLAQDGGYPLAIIALVGAVGLVIKAYRQRTAIFYVFLSAITIRRARITRMVDGAIPVVFVGFIPLIQSPVGHKTLLVILFCTIVILGIARAFFSFGIKQLRSRRQNGVLFEIRGLHPKALEYLKQVQLKRSNSAQSAAPSHSG
jgi:hypothetical protein